MEEMEASVGLPSSPGCLAGKNAPTGVWESDSWSEPNLRALLAWTESSLLALGAFVLGLPVLQSGFGEFGF